MKIFQESPNYFYHFLKLDLSFLSDVLGYRTSVILEKVHLEKAHDFLQKRIVLLLKSAKLSAVASTAIPLELQSYNSNTNISSCHLLFMTSVN